VKEHDYFWLDLALYYGAEYVRAWSPVGWLNQTQNRELERNNRVTRIIDPLRLPPKTEEQLKLYSKAVVIWFNGLNSEQKEIFDPALQGVLQVIYDAVKDRPGVQGVSHTDFINRYFNDSQTVFCAIESNGIQFGIDPGNYHSMTTSQWIPYAMNSHFITMCQICGIPFNPARSKTMYCSNRCKQASKKYRD
jgi:hypothetical protein